MVLVGLGVIYKAGSTQTVKRAYYIKLRDSLTTRLINIEADRGNIFSEDGSLLATSVPIYDVRFDAIADPITNKIWDEKSDSLARGLAELFRDKNISAYKKLLNNGRKSKDRYLLLQRNVEYVQAQKVKNLPLFNMGKYKGGLILVEKTRREMPFGDMAKRTIGYFVQNVKPVGVEGAFDAYLAGTSGKRLMQRISAGVWMPLNDNNEIEPRNGQDVHTTIDVNIQDIAQTALMKGIDSNDAEKGCVIVMEVATGKIKAIANLGRDKSGNYTERYNYAIGEGSEPGSTFKLASLLIGFEDKKFDLTDTVDIFNGLYSFGSAQMKDSKPHAYRKVSVQKVFEMSSNVGVSRLIHKHYKDNPQAFYEGLKNLHLTDMLELQVKGEEPPYIKKPSSRTWSKTSLPWMSIGYELKITPLQTLNLYNAVANNGKMMRPLLISSITELGRTVEKYEPEVIAEKIASDSTIAWCKRMMEGVVLQGTAHHIQPKTYSIAGKTGTAQIANKASGYDKSNYQASFAGYFPANNPIYSCIVVIKNPSKGAIYGGAVAAPVFKEIADRVYAGFIEPSEKVQTDSVIRNQPKLVVKPGKKDQILTVLRNLKIQNTAPSQATWVKAATQTTPITLTTNENNAAIVPNVIGMGLRDAIYLLEKSGLRVKVNGVGSVQRQSVQSGLLSKNFKEITLDLG